jgi:hypothetical protein
LYAFDMTASAARAPESPSSAEEYVELVRSLLANGEAGAARRVAAEGAARFPDHPWLEKTDRVINPKAIIATSGGAPERTREFAWLRENSARYRGNWVALLGDRLLASGRELANVFQEIRSQGLESKALVHHIA